MDTSLDNNDEDECHIEDPVDYDQALGDLDNIESQRKRILDDDDDIKPDIKNGLKRSPSVDATEPDSKKIKVSEQNEEVMKENGDEGERKAKKKLKKVLRKLTRQEIEDLVCNKMVEVMTNKSEIGKFVTFFVYKMGQECYGKSKPLSTD